MFCSRSLFSLALSDGFCLPSERFFFALLLASPLPFLIFFWTHQHFHTLSLLSWEERRSRDEIVRTTFLSIADRVEVFNARSFLNYSWKRQIRRPFSVRAYGNGDKSDLTAVFLSIENIRSPNFRFLSPFLIFSLRFFFYSPLFLILGLSLFNATFLFIRYFSLYSAHRIYLRFIFSRVAFLEICGSVILTFPLLTFLFFFLTWWYLPCYLLCIFLLYVICLRLQSFDAASST